MSKRRDETTEVEVTPQIRLTLHQSELFGARYQFGLVFDAHKYAALNQNYFTLDVESARRLHEAFGTLLAKVEDEEPAT